MNRWTAVFAMMLLATLIATGCNGSNIAPVTPNTAAPDISGATDHSGQTQTHLWGYYDCFVDLDTMTINAVPNRDVMFTANVVQFVNGNPANLSFYINGTPSWTGCSGAAIDVDIDVSITHPFPNMHQYDGYDVRGVFIGDQSATMVYDNDLLYGVECTDQVMLDCWKCLEEPCEDDCKKISGSPDGYSRWFNPPEFPTPGLFGYTPGVVATPGYTGDATLCPYKYFADSLDTDDNLWTFLTTTTDDGVFTSGATNTRNYYLRFPVPDPGVSFNYAILANWEAEDVHPSNTFEAVGCKVEVTDNLYYESASNWGGNLIADIDLFGWQHEPSTVYVESSVLYYTHVVPPTSWHPEGSGYAYSTLHIDIPAYIVHGEGCVEDMWVIAEYESFDYKNDFGSSNTVSDDLAAFFRFCVDVLPESPCPDVVIDGLYYYDPPGPPPPPLPPPPPPPIPVPPGPPPGNSPGVPAGKVVITGEGFTGVTNVEFREHDGPLVVPGSNIEVIGDDYLQVEVDFPFAVDSFFDVFVEVELGCSGLFPNMIQIVAPLMFHESFDDPPSADWTLYAYDWWDNAQTTPAMQHTTETPYYGSTPGNLRYPATGAYVYGLLVLTVVTPPFDVPDTFTDVWLRVYGCMGGMGDDDWWGANCKIVESSTPGLDPFFDNGWLWGDVEVIEATGAHSAGWGPYSHTPLTYWDEHLAGQDAWGDDIGGFEGTGAGFPPALTEYFDVTIPPFYFGKTVKVAFQLGTDMDSYLDPSAGVALDEFQLMGE